MNMRCFRKKNGLKYPLGGGEFLKLRQTIALDSVAQGRTQKLMKLLKHQKNNITIEK